MLGSPLLTSHAASVRGTLGPTRGNPEVVLSQKHMWSSCGMTTALPGPRLLLPSLSTTRSFLLSGHGRLRVAKGQRMTL